MHDAAMNDQSPATAAKGPFVVRVHTAEGGAFPDLAEPWAQCLAACPPQQQLYSFGWYASWAQTYGARPPWTGRTAVLAVTDGAGAPCAFLPMSVRRAQGLTYLSLAGFYQPLRTFPCIPALAEPVARALVQTLFREVPGWDVLRFGPTDDAAPERAALLRAIAEQARHRVTIPRGRTIVNRLDDPQSAQADSKTYKRIESYARAFEREPGAAVRHVSNPGPAEAQALLRDLGAVEQHSWLAREGGDLRFVSETDHAFWERAIDSGLHAGRQLDVWMAYLGERPVGFRVVLSSGGAEYMIANQYDEQAREFRLGWILYLHHLREATARGTRFIDSAPGDLHYKGRLGGVEAEMRQDVFVFRNSPRGWALARLLGGLHHARERLSATPWGRRLAARLPRV